MNQNRLTAQANVGAHSSPSRKMRNANTTKTWHVLSFGFGPKPLALQKPWALKAGISHVHDRTFHLTQLFCL
jgi:hypothetical protein